MALRVVVIQHGEKERLPGDPGLTGLGRRQAQATAEWLGARERSEAGAAPLGIWVSPMRRALETSAPIAEALAVEVTVDPRLRERMNWEDPDSESIEAFLDDWRTATADRSHIPRSGDSSAQAGARFVDALDDLAQQHAVGTAIVVAHGGVTTDALRTLLGDDALRARAPALIDDGVPCCALTTLESTGGGFRVASIAVTDHLTDDSAHRPA